MRADSAVEPTKSENTTVTCRRSARSSGGALGVLDLAAAAAEGPATPASVRRAAIASSSFTRCPKRRDAKLLQVLVRQTRKDRLVYVILAECRLVLPEAQAPQPDHHVHDGCPSIMGGEHHFLAHKRCPGQIGLSVSQRFTKTAAVISPTAVFIADCENTGLAFKS